GRGVATIIEMVSATRLDCVLGSAAAIRQAAVTAVHHATFRRSFGRTLISHPLMRSVLADLALEAEAATALAMRLAGAADRVARGDAAQAALLRLALPAGKFWLCKRTPVVAGEAAGTAGSIRRSQPCASCSRRRPPRRPRGRAPRPGPPRSSGPGGSPP